LAITLIIVLFGMLGVKFIVQEGMASGTIYIRADGSVEGTDKILRDGDVYTFTDDIYDEIVVERSYIAIDGNGYTLQGFGSGVGIELDHLFYVTIEHLNVDNFSDGIYVRYSSYTTISENNITDNDRNGIFIHYSSNFNNISGNNIVANDYGVHLDQYPSNNTILENYIADNRESGIFVGNKCASTTIFNNTITWNSITNHWGAIYVIGVDTYHNNVTENTIEDNFKHGVEIRTAYTTVSRNVIRGNLADGVHIEGTRNKINNNEITANTRGIILTNDAHYNDVSYNNLSDNEVSVIYLTDSSWNRISGNQIIGNQGIGVGLGGSSSNNEIFENNIEDNQVGVSLLTGDSYFYNTVYHNNIVNNTNQVTTCCGYINDWTGFNNMHGNYWSDYSGVDSNHDGLGDTPYLIDEYNLDYLPLMGKIHKLSKAPGYDIYLVSNSTLDRFEHFENNNTIRIYVSSISSTEYGFCRLIMPRSLMAPPYEVTINDGSTDVLFLNDTLYSPLHSLCVLYFAYEHSTHEIIIVPEFPSFLILPLFMIAALLAVIVYRRKHFTKPKERIAE